VFRACLGIGFHSHFPCCVQVITWVNGSDPVRQENRKAYGGPARTTDRDRDNNELFFALRGIHAYMPWWKGKLLLVAEEWPCWLKKGHPRIRWVRHAEFFQDQDETLPTFNSQAIEAQVCVVERAVPFHLSLGGVIVWRFLSRG
jgi:hypothetical protein